MSKRKKKQSFAEWYAGWEKHIKGQPYVDKCTSGYGSNPQGFSCGVCGHFRPPSACTVVEGEIKAEDCCNLFASATFRSPCRETR